MWSPRKTGGTLLLAAPVLILAVWPIVRLFIEGFPGFSWQPLVAEWSRASTLKALGNSLITAAGGTIFAVLVGTLAALAVSLVPLPSRRVLVFCLVLPTMIAPQVTALAWLQVFGPSSVLLQTLGLAPKLGTPNLLYSMEGIILLLGVQYAPLVFLTVRAGLRSLPPELLEAGLSSGASPFRVVRTIVLPLAGPSLAVGASLAFVSCLGNFGIPAVLGIPGHVPVLATLIYQRLSSGGVGGLPDVASLSILIGVLAAAGVGLQRLFGGRDHGTGGAVVSPHQFSLERLRPLVEVLLWLYVIAVLVLPFLALTLGSLIPAFGVKLSLRTLTLDNFAYVLFGHDAARRALVNSFFLSASAALAVVLLSLPLAQALARRRSRVLTTLAGFVELPYALPGVVLSIALILIFLKPLPLIHVSLYNTMGILLVAYLSRFFSLGLGPLVAAFGQLDRTLDEAAAMVGARPWRRFWTVAVPLVFPAASAAALLIFLTAFCELTVSALLWSTGNETLGVVVFSFEQGGDATLASALSVVVFVVTAGLMLAANAFAKKLPPGALPWRD